MIGIYKQIVQIVINKYRQMDGWIDRQTDRQIGRQVDRQIDRLYIYDSNVRQIDREQYEIDSINLNIQYNTTQVKHIQVKPYIHRQINIFQI